MQDYNFSERVETKKNETLDCSSLLPNESFQATVQGGGMQAEPGRKGDFP